MLMPEVWLPYTVVQTYDQITNIDVVLVGFTGSGQAMRKDPGRSKHVYQQIEDDGY